MSNTYMSTKKKPRNSLAKRNWKKFKRNRVAVAGLVVIVIIIMACALAPLLTPYGTNDVDLKNMVKPPSLEHPLGTDKIGRDVFARMLYGGRMSILVGLSGALGGVSLGVIIGCVCGYVGGWLDRIMLRFSELLMVFPSIILVLILVVLTGRGVQNLIIIFVFTGWMGTYRRIRASIFTLREEDFVQALRAMGVKKPSIMFRHMLPNMLSPLVIDITMGTAGYILAETGLSYLGLGVESGIPTWGNIMSVAKDLTILTNYPWLWLTPGLALSTFVLGVNFVGDGLRDAFDPKSM